MRGVAENGGDVDLLRDMSDTAARSLDRWEISALALVNDRLSPDLRCARLLSTLGWSPVLEDRFFASGCERLPEPEYAVDRDGANARIAALQRILEDLEGEGLVIDWLRRVVKGFLDAHRMVLAVGTKEFHSLSVEMFGSSGTPFFQQGLDNLGLADHLLARLTVRSHRDGQPEEASIPAEEFATLARRRLSALRPRLPLEIVLDQACPAKAQASSRRLRIRSDALFRPSETQSLFLHEILTHALTAQNGERQKRARFLKNGGPRTTATQEGLALFCELYHRTLDAERMERLAVRVKLVDMAERGADFTQLYRWLLDRGVNPHDAFLDAQRICRGGVPSGGAPFTKDACYLSGLMHVYTVMSVLIRSGMRSHANALVLGRIALEDLPAMMRLLRADALAAPRHLPPWLADWHSLVPYFAFSSFTTGLDLSPIEAHYEQKLGSLLSTVAPAPHAHA